MERIVETKRHEVDRAKRQTPWDAVRRTARAAAPPRDFLSAVTAASPNGPQLIAEIKRKSPSAGLIRPDFDPAALAKVYARHGAAAISVLTDETYFGGQLAFIELVKKAVPLPVLRKEFIIDEYQAYESRAAGADAILLIVEAIGIERVVDLAPVAQSLGMTCLIEVHAEENLLCLLERLGPPAQGTADGQPHRDCSAQQPGHPLYLLGINNRDLTVQRTDVETTVRLARYVPTGCAFVAESGLSTRLDVERVHQAGACAILVGESLLRESDIGAKIDELRGAS